MKAYTSLEQSKKLAEILPLESADMFIADVFLKEEQTHSYNFHVLTTWGHKNFNELKERENKFVQFIPCWSLAALLNYLREIDFFPSIEADEHGVTMNVCYYDDEEGKLLNPVHDIITEADNFVDACVDMILKLHEQKIL